MKTIEERMEDLEKQYQILKQLEWDLTLKCSGLEHLLSKTREDIVKLQVKVNTLFDYE